MPPVPAALDTESLALIELVERRLNDLSTFQIPRLRACTGPLATQQKWAAEIREDVERVGRQIEELDVLVDDQRTERARRQLRVRVDTFRDTLEKLRKDARGAILASKHAIDAQRQSQREELLGSPSVTSEKVLSGNGKTKEDALMRTSNNVTETLQRTMDLMQKELERSVLSTQLIESSTTTLQLTAQTHDSLSLLLGSSRQLISVLEKTDTLDRLLIMAALVFFCLVVLFILQQRVIQKGFRITFWWTRFVDLPRWNSGNGKGDDYMSAVENAITTGSVTAASIESVLAVAAASVVIAPSATSLAPPATLPSSTETTLVGTSIPTVDDSILVSIYDAVTSASDSRMSFVPDVTVPGTWSTVTDPEVPPTSTRGSTRDEL
ncbi:Sec20-domain-containing protein [Pisolithus marmoratus]|nr:Sec20-domain-containing protein [Pisolithus marmoratus]